MGRPFLSFSLGIKPVDFSPQPMSVTSNQMNTGATSAHSLLFPALPQPVGQRFVNIQRSTLATDSYSSSVHELLVAGKSPWFLGWWVSALISLIPSYRAPQFFFPLSRMPPQQTSSFSQPRTTKPWVTL